MSWSLHFGIWGFLERPESTFCFFSQSRRGCQSEIAGEVENFPVENVPGIRHEGTLSCLFVSFPFFPFFLFFFFSSSKCRSQVHAPRVCNHRDIFGKVINIVQYCVLARRRQPVDLAFGWGGNISVFGYSHIRSPILYSRSLHQLSLYSGLRNRHMIFLPNATLGPFPLPYPLSRMSQKLHTRLPRQFAP